MGDGAKDKGARNKLIEENQGLVLFVANQYAGSGVEFEDLFSIGMVGLIKAADTFRPEKKIKFATYAVTCIRNEIRMYFRQSQKYKKEISLNSVLGIDEEGNELHLFDIMETGSDDISRRLEDADDRAMLMSAIKSLSERERILIVLLYGLDRQDCDGRTQLEVGRRLGISGSYVSRIRKRALQHLRRECMRLAG